MLKIENLSIVYGDRIILDNVKIAFPKGSVSVIKGASGSGKSSLLNVLGLMQQPNELCTYYKDKIDVSRYTEKEKADFRLHNIGFVFQQNNLIQELSAHENVSLPCMIFGKDEHMRRKVNDILDYVGVSHLAKNYPGSLSGGEEQRVAIARALANDADIILADEPTASLDETNANIVLAMLQKLAHELNKIVVIVSHDEHVLSIADYVYEIEDKKIKQVSSEKVKKADSLLDDTQKKVTFGQRKMLDFIQFYTKSRTGDWLINKIFIGVTAVIAAVAIIFINFGTAFTQGQQDFINAISDRSIFVVNDTLGIGGDTVYTGAMAMNNVNLSKIDQVENVQSWYPYYEFNSIGVSGNAEDKASILIKDGNEVVAHKEYDEREIQKEREKMVDEERGNGLFSVAPLFSEENISYLLSHKSDNDQAEGVIISGGLARTLNVRPESLINKEIQIKVFVPIKLYETTIRVGNPNVGNVDKRQEIKGTNVFSKLVTITSKIRGVLDDRYDLHRSENEDLILLNYKQVDAILQENKDEHYGETFPGFPEKALAPIGLVIFANSYNDVPTVVSDLQRISPSFTVTNKATDFETVEANIKSTRDMMLLITIVFICVIVLMFGVLYYIKNRSRKKEVGILKAMGLTSGNIVQLITFEMSQIALKSFIHAVIIAFVLVAIGNFFAELELFKITLLSVLVGLFVSVAIVIVAGVLPIYSASKVDPIHAIREINK